VMDRMQTAAALRAYGYGLLFYAWLKVLQPAFYAIDKRWLPMLVSIFALGLNLGFNYLFVFVFKWGHESLALTTSITASVNFIILFLAMRKFAGDLGTGDLLILLMKLVIAGAAMGGVCLLANHLLFSHLTETNWVVKAGGLGATIALAAGIYFVASKLMRVSEAEEALAMVLRKLRR
jgi:putative peptidoglycan lipid II flippase